MRPPHGLPAAPSLLGARELGGVAAVLLVLGSAGCGEERDVPKIGHCVEDLGPRDESSSKLLVDAIHEHYGNDWSAQLDPFADLVVETSKPRDQWIPNDAPSTIILLRAQAEEVARSYLARAPELFFSSAAIYKSASLTDSSLVQGHDSTWVVRFSAHGDIAGYEGLPADGYGSYQVTVQFDYGGDVVRIAGSQGALPHLTLCKDPLLRGDDPLLLREVVGRTFTYLGEKGPVVTGPFVGGDIESVTLALYVQKLESGFRVRLAYRILVAVWTIYVDADSGALIAYSADAI